MFRGSRHILLVTALLISACATTTNVPAATAPAVVEPATVGPEPIDPTATVPAPASPTPPLPTTTATDAASTDTPVPSVTVATAIHWHWAIHPDTGQIMAVDPVGAAHPVGEPRPDLLQTALSFPIDLERALLLVDDREGAGPGAFLLTSTAMDPIVLPTDLPFDALRGMAIARVLAVYADRLAFSYQTFSGSSGDNGTIDPPSGPIVLVDLATRTATLVDPDINVMYFDDPRAWAHASPDHRYLRYIAGTHEAYRIRELDLLTGEARTVYASSGKVTYRNFATSDGSAWVIDRDGVLLAVTDGAQTSMSTEAGIRLPYDSTTLIETLDDCEDACAVQFTPLSSGEPPSVFQLPLGRLGPLTTLLPGLLPTGDAIIGTDLLRETASDPALSETYPGLEFLDQAVFRLSPDGGSEFLGLLPYDATVGPDPLPFSADGRYALLLTPDRAAYRLLDLIEDRSLFEVSIEPGLDSVFSHPQFFDHGVLFAYDGETPDGKVHAAHYSYLFATGHLASMDENEPTFTTCNELLPDGSIVCWHYADWNVAETQLVRFDPSWSSSTILLDGHYPLEPVP